MVRISMTLLVFFHLDILFRFVFSKTVMNCTYDNVFTFIAPKENSGMYKEDV